MTDAYPQPPCPFCAIASKHPPTPPGTAPAATAKATTASTTEPASKTHLILSTKHVLAFLDIMPLTRGHVLITTREHYAQLGGVGVEVGMELGKWLPVISRVVMRTVQGGGGGGGGGGGHEHEDANTNSSNFNTINDTSNMKAHWNVVQNNGIRAAQVVPHVHFHIVPRPPLHETPSSSSSSSSSSNSRTTKINPSGPTPAAPSAPVRKSFVMFGRGQRDDLDDEEGEALAAAMRVELGREVRRVWEEEGVRLGVEGEGGFGGGSGLRGRGKL